jgi:phosphinothricin acetyltransferase
MQAEPLELHTPRLRLRRLCASDAATLCGYRSLPEVARFQSWERFDARDAARLLAGQAGLQPDTPGTWFQLGIVDRASDRLVGDCGLHFRADQPDQVELGITLDPASQRIGIAREALRGVLGYLFGTLGKHRITAVVDADNPAAANLFRKLGFRNEAHLVEHTRFKGRWGSELLFALLRREWEGHAAEAGDARPARIAVHSARTGRTPDDASGCTIRRATPDDAASLLSIYAPYVERTSVSFEESLPSVDEFAARIAHALSRWTWLVAELDGRCAGYAYATSHRARAAYRWSVETSAYLDERMHRRGIGRALYHSLLVELCAQGYCNAYAGIALPNDASVALHRALRFEPIGVFEAVGRKFATWQDVSWWHRRLRDTPIQSDD